MSQRLERAAMAAYGAFGIAVETDPNTAEVGQMPPWAQLPESVRAHWRAVADAVLMMDDLHTASGG